MLLRRDYLTGVNFKPLKKVGLNFFLLHTTSLEDRSTGAVEYTDCISAKGVIPPFNECPRYDGKQSDGEAPVMLEICGMRSALSIAIAPMSTLSPEW